MYKWWAQICTSTTPTQLSILLIHARWAQLQAQTELGPLKAKDFDWTIVGPKKELRKQWILFLFL